MLLLSCLAPKCSQTSGQGFLPTDNKQKRPPGILVMRRKLASALGLGLPLLLSVGAVNFAKVQGTCYSHSMSRLGKIILLGVDV